MENKTHFKFLPNIQKIKDSQLFIISNDKIIKNLTSLKQKCIRKKKRYLYN